MLVRFAYQYLQVIFTNEKQDFKKRIQKAKILGNENKNRIFQNHESRLPVAARSLRPDCSTINLAETSDQPKDWLLHPTGITFKFDAKLKTV